MQQQYKRLILLPQKDKSVLRKHPWIFSGALQKSKTEIKEGEFVEVYNSNKDFLCVGFWQNASIAVKVLSFEKEQINYDFVLNRIKQAYDYRKSLGFFSNPSTNIFRLINAEGDFMPSLIADYYNGLIVLQFHSVGMLNLQEYIVKALQEVLQENCKAIFSKSSSTLPKQNEGETDRFLFGNIEGEWFAKENNLSFRIDFNQGQKTGFFIDQRVNRELVGSLSKDRNVLNAFSYTGGFSLAAIQGGAKKVLSLDISKRAVELCEENVRVNFQNHNHQALAVDVLEYLDQVPKGEFDLIVLDPPAFAKHNRNLNQALKGYRQINQKAMEKIAKGGFLFTFSCSQAVSREDFGTMLFSCAALANRKIRIVQRLPHAMDHPQSIFHPEGEYLKGFLLQVE